MKTTTKTRTPKPAQYEDATQRHSPEQLEVIAKLGGNAPELEIQDLEDTVSFPYGGKTRP